MIKSKFLSQCGVSMLCLMVALGTNAYAKTTTLFELPINIPTPDSCSITNTSVSDNNTIVNFRCGNQDTSVSIPNGETGPQGAGCVTKSLTSNSDSQTLVLTCGTGSSAEDTTITIPNGQGCNLAVSKDPTTRDVSVTKSCGNETPTTTVISHSDIVNDAANKIVTENNFQTGTQVETAITSAVSGLASKEDLNAATSVGALTTSLTGVFVKPTDNTFVKPTDTTFVKPSDVTSEKLQETLGGVYATTDQLSGKLDKTDADYVALKTNAVTTSTLTEQLGTNDNKAAIAAAIDLSNYATTSALQTLENSIYTKEEVNSMVSAAAAAGCDGSVEVLTEQVEGQGGGTSGTKVTVVCNEEN